MQIHLFRPDLLGARILNFVYGYALAGLCARPFQLHWPTFHKFANQAGYGYDDNLFDLFQRQELMSALADANGIIDEDSFDLQQDRGPDLINLVKTASARRECYTLDTLLSANVDIVFSHVEPLSIGGIDRLAWRDLARDILLNLPDREEIAREIAAISNTLPSGRTVAIHIRRGDIVADLMTQTTETVQANGHKKPLSNFLMRFVPVSVYREYLKASDFDAALLFSDEGDIALGSVFEDILPTVNMTSKVQRLPLTKIQNDFIEIRLMGRCDAILASQSRFSQLASLYAGSETVDLSGAGCSKDYMDELHERYSLTIDHPVYRHLDEAIRRHAGSPD